MSRSIANVIELSPKSVVCQRQRYGYRFDLLKRSNNLEVVLPRQSLRGSDAHHYYTPPLVPKGVYTNKHDHNF